MIVNTRHIIDIATPIYVTIDNARASVSSITYNTRKKGIHNIMCKFINCVHTPCVPVTSTNTAKLVKWLLRQVIAPVSLSKTVSIPSLDHPPLPILDLN